MMTNFQEAYIPTGETTIYVRWSGAGPPVLLLHGFPQTHLMWRDVAPMLSSSFTVVCADLRGYGRSGCPTSSADHSPYSKRVMARDMVAVMEHLGFRKFSVAGHDRGGRVAYRLSLDHPERVDRAVVLDIVPTEEAWARADAQFALGYWPWILLAQPQPLPERLIEAAPEAIVNNALDNWGSAPRIFDQTVRQAYVDALRDPGRIHAICEEYRAAATIDREHDRKDLQDNRRITCPLTVLWSFRGPLNEWYVKEGGPLEIWRAYAVNVQGRAIEGGHFFPEELPEETAAAISGGSALSR